MDFVFFLNGLPIVALEVKHEANQNVHDAVAQFTRPATTATRFSSTRFCISPPTPAT
ncbi:MAG: type I restriction endonuclease [Deltaproteobacteria bacterium]|nr:type I restriction endonuclease [Deltaproteobacteria bacterium]